MASDGYYALYDYPKEMTTDTAGTFKMSKIDMTTTDVTYSFKYDFICDGVTTSKTVATGLTATEYTWTPTTATFAPLMTKSDQGTLKVAIESSNGRKMTYYATITLKLKASIKPSVNFQYAGLPGFNNKAIAGISSFTFTINVPGLYGASQTVKLTINDTDYVQNVPAVSGTTNTAVTFDVGTFRCNDPTATYTRWFFTIEITDSRSRSNSQTDWITIYPYSPPDVVATVDRNANEQPVLTFTPSYQATVAGATNALTIFWARCNVDGEVYETDLKDKTSPQVLTGTYDLAKSYQFTIAIKDSVRQSAIIKRVVLPSARPIMDIGADGNTVTFFGTSPSSADKTSLRVIGDEIVFRDGNMVYAQIGYDRVKDSSGNTSNNIFYTLGTRLSNSKIGLFSMVEGSNNTASGAKSHAEGGYNVASGANSHVEGYSNTASGEDSHAEGYHTTASGSYSHAEGGYTTANGTYSHSSGYNTKAMSSSQMVVGKYNIEDASSKYLFIVGNGSSSARSNAFAVSSTGAVDIKNSVYLNTVGTGIYQKDASANNRQILSLGSNGRLDIGYGQYASGSRETKIYAGDKLSFNLYSASTTWTPYYTKGDSRSITIQVGCYITNASKDVTFTIPLNRPVIGSTTVTIASVDGICVRQNNKYLYGSAASTMVKPSSYTAVLVAGSLIRVIAKMSNTTNVENNSACGLWASLNITFS